MVTQCKGGKCGIHPEAHTFVTRLLGKRVGISDSPENSTVATRCLRSPQRMTASANFIEIQRRAYSLPETERASLAPGLLASLPPVLVEEDDGLEDARRRSAELDADASLGFSWDEIKLALER